jgi:selenide,water dikinase
MITGGVPVLKDIVLVGAGHAHVGVLRSFGMKPIPGVRLTLITRQVDTPYSGMLPGLVAGTYDVEDVHIDTGPLARFANARLYHDEAVGLDLGARRVICSSRPPVAFDLLSIDIGSTPGGVEVPGVRDHAIPVKPIDRFLERFEAARARILAAGGKVRIGVVGGGAAGVELVLALDQRIRRDLAAAGADPAALEVVLVAGSPTILPTLPGAARARLERILNERGIEVMTASRVVRIDGSAVEIEDKPGIRIDEVFWTTQARPAPWLGETGLALDQRGFIAIDDALQSLSHPGVFAVGDTASMQGHDLPKSGVYAVRQGPYLADNLRLALAGRPLRRYRPQRDALYLISTGERYAVGVRNGISFEGKWAWRWKDWIDRRFMERFNRLPEMAAPAETVVYGIADQEAIREISALAMRCGGCGAKVGATVLSRALGRIEPVERDDVVIGLDAPDDAAVVDTGAARLSVLTVDYFRAIVDDPYMFGRIAATHALGDVFAMGAEPQTAMAIATVPYGIEAKVEAELSDLMTGANQVLREAGCALVGGHTSEGAELALGFSISGLISRDEAWRKGGLEPGDVLILTKPIGTGTLLAADMRGKARARWVMAALQHMTSSNGRAVKVLGRHGVHAATDVTGFGLLGHLVEMVRASDVDGTLRLAAIPVLEGARDTIAAGIFSSLQPQNVRLRSVIRNLEAASRHTDFPLLFDPQTSGGLLASVPAANAESCIGELIAEGYADAAVIGSVAARSGALEPISILLDASVAFAAAAAPQSTESGPRVAPAHPIGTGALRR